MIYVLILLSIAPALINYKYNIFGWLFKFYFLMYKYRKVILIFLFFASLFSGIFVYSTYYGLENKASIYYALTQFLGEVKMPVEIGLLDINTSISTLSVNEIKKNYDWIYYSASLALFTSFLTFLLLFFKEAIQRLHASFIAQSDNHIIVFGLGKKGMAYIDSELKKRESQPIIVIEKDPSNINIEKYREKYIEKEFAIKVGDASSIILLKELNMHKTKHIVLLAGKDTENIEIALSVSNILNKLKEEDEEIAYIDTYMHLEDKDLHKFYREGGLFDDSSLLHIKIFSMAKNSARSLFLEHDIDGDSRKYIDSNRPFGIAVVGNSNLALEVIGQACEIAHFPNENVMTIYCIDNNIAAFRRLIYHRYPNIDEISTINIEFKKLNFKFSKFYEESFWKKDLTNVMLCYEDGQNNLDIASELADSTYLKNIKKKRMNTKIHIAIYENIQIAKKINKNKQQFMHFDVFAETFKMASTEMIIEAKFEIISKCVHASYEERYEPWRLYNEKIKDSHLTKIDKDWIDTARLSDRVSNRAQAYHVPIKLKALGFTYKDDTSSRSICGKLKYNKLLMNRYKGVFNDNFPKIMGERKNLKLDDKALTRVTEKYFGENKWGEIEKFDSHYYPKNFITLFEKLIRSEHNRWNAHHYLKGWEFGDKDKELKTHDCLVSLENMKEKNRFTILYDIYSILYIPNYLARAGYTIRIPVTIGVTGHRELDPDKIEMIKEILSLKLDKFSNMYHFHNIVSPLADGSDRLVAKMLMNNYDSKLIVLLPFEKDEYKKDFVEDSKKEFDTYLREASSVYEVGSLEKNSRDECYLNVGIEVVDQCDILIALWDGKEANGVGGTGDIVKYAEEQGKVILHINTNKQNKF